MTKYTINDYLEFEKNNNGALGMVAMLYFSEDGKNVEVEYYSTTTDRYYRSINQLSFELDLVGDDEPETTDTEVIVDTDAAASPATESGCASTLSISTLSLLVLALGSTVALARKKED